MTASDASPARSPRWRHRVRLLTAGVTGAAVLAAGGLTVMLAAGQDAAATTPTVVAEDPSAGDPSARQTGGADDQDEERSPLSGPGSGSLIAPVQPPAGATGRGHVRTGGS